MYHARTQLVDPNGVRLNFTGLFTEKPLPRGAFVGLYTGEWVTPRAYKRRDVKKRDRYAVNCSVDERYEEVICSPRPLFPRSVNSEKYPMAMANEPGLGKEANLILREYNFSIDELQFPNLVPDDLHDHDFAALGLVTSLPVCAHEELSWYYGADFKRKYKVGRQSKLPKLIEDPLDILGTIPNVAVCIDVTN